MAVSNLAPTVRSLVMGILVVTLALPAVSAAPAAADASGPASADALNAKIKKDATLIHQLTEELDQARLRVSATADRLVSVTRQHDSTVQVLEANRVVLLQQALRAYMHGGSTPKGASAGADVTLGSEYLRVASGDLANTGDQLRALEANLRGDLAMLRNAEHASVQATVELQALRANALSAAAKEQVQLEVLQSQLMANVQAAAALPAPAGGHAPPRAAATQGVPVNNGLVAVVQQAAGLPVATPVATPVVKPVTPSAPPAPPNAAGGNAGGAWLSLRRCESSDNYAENTGNGYYGAYQFSLSTWLALGYSGRPDLGSPAMQDDAAMKLQAQAGWGQWPACAAALGLA